PRLWALPLLPAQSRAAASAPAAPARGYGRPATTLGHTAPPAATRPDHRGTQPPRSARSARQTRHRRRALLGWHGPPATRAPTHRCGRPCQRARGTGGPDPAWHSGTARVEEHGPGPRPWRGRRI